MSKILHSKWQAAGLLTLALLMMLCPGRVHAVTLRVSELGTERVHLTGATTINVDQDWYLREITGGEYDLTIRLSNNATLTVDQDKEKYAAIDAKSLDVSGNGTLYVTGRSLGVLLHGGDLKVTDCNATFVGRQVREGSDYWGTAVEGDINDVIFSNAKVDISGDLLGIGTSCKKIKITGDNSVLNAWAKWHCFQPEEFIMEGGEVNLTTRIGCPLAVRKRNANITGGKLTISAGEGWCGMRFLGNLVASDCELNISSTYEAINSPEGSATFTNAKVNINVGASHCGIVLGGDLTIDGNSDFYVNASHEAIVCGGNMSLKADRFYAKTRTDDYHTVLVEGNMTIKMGKGTYEAYMTNASSRAPFLARKTLTVDRPYTVNDIYDLSRLSIEHHWTDRDEDMPTGGDVFLVDGIRIKGVKLTRPNLRYYRETDQKARMVGGCFDKGTYTFGETIHFNAPSEITAFINKPVSNPNAKLSISWYRIPASGRDELINNDGKTSYTVTAADMNCSIYAVFSYDTHISSLETERVSVQKKICNDLPVTPALAFRQNYVWVTNNNPAQEYLLLTTYKDVTDLTEADWANAESSTASSFRLSGTTGQVNYVYTRYKETATQLPGSVVHYNAVYYGTTDQIKDVLFEITDITANTPVEVGKNGYTPVLINHVIKIDLVPVPDNITNFYGLPGEDWWIDSQVTYYRDAACTQEIHDGEFNNALDYDTYYKTLYVKFTQPTETLAGTNPNRAHYVTFTYNNVSKDVNFIVSKTDGTYNLLDLYAANGRTPNGADYPALYVPAGTTFEIPMDYAPVKASTDGITFWINGYSQNGVANTGNPPTLSYYKDSDGQLMLRVNTTNTEDGFYGEYRAKQDGRDIPLNSPAMFLYVTAPEPTGLDINPSEITLEPLFGEAQLEAMFIPANAMPKPITWSSSDQNVVTVDQNGKVTVAENAIGDEATITATAGGFTATCKVIVSGQKYPVWVKGTQINSLIQDDVFMDGTVSYVGGTLTLNGATISGSGAKGALTSEVPNLTINVEGTNTLSTTSGEAVALVKSAYITGDGELTVTTTGGSNLSVALAGYEDLTIDGSVKVSAFNNSSSGVGVMSRRLSVNSPEAQIRGRGKFAAVGYFEELVGTVIDPQGCQPVYYEGLDGYFIGDASGNIIKDWVTIGNNSTIVENFTGTLWQTAVSNGQSFNSSETKKTVTLTSSIDTPELTSIAFPSFTSADRDDKISGFNIKDVSAIDYENGSTLYTLPEEISMTLTKEESTRWPVRNMMVKGAKSKDGRLVLKLTMSRIGITEFTLLFGPAEMTLNQIVTILNETEEIITGVDGVEIDTKDDVIYDLSGRKIEKITQPGIYIKNGKKVLIK